MRACVHRTWWLIFAALAVCVVVTCRWAVASGDLDQRIAKQELVATHAWNAACDAKETFWTMQADWREGWPRMHDPYAYARLIEKQWKAYSKAMVTWQRECVRLVKLYDEHRRD